MRVSPPPLPRVIVPIVSSALCGHHQASHAPQSRDVRKTLSGTHVGGDSIGPESNPTMCCDHNFHIQFSMMPLHRGK